MKKILGLMLILLIIITGCSKENDSKQVEEKSQNSTEELKTWTLTNPESISTDNGSIELYGEVGKYALAPDTFRVENEGKHTWYFWVEPEKKEEMIGKKVTITGINEKDKNEEMDLAESEIVELSNDEAKTIPDSENVLKFEGSITPLREGKWKLNTYVDDSNLGTTVIEAQGK